MLQYEKYCTFNESDMWQIMVELISKEDIENHAWLSSWNKLDNDLKIDVLRTKIMDLENLIGTVSIMVFVLICVVAGCLFLMLASKLFGGAVSMNEVGMIGGLIKQFTGK